MNGLRDKVLYFSFNGYIRVNEKCLTAVALDFFYIFLTLIIAYVRQNDNSTLAGKTHCNGPPYSAGSSRHNDNLVLKTHHRDPPVNTQTFAKIIVPLTLNFKYRLFCNYFIRFL